MSNLTESERKFVRNYTKKLVIMSSLATAFFGTVLVAAYTGNINLEFKSTPLETVQDRLVFTLKHISLQLAWIILAIYYVIFKRIGTPALDPSKGYEKLVQNAKNILNNSIEHGFVFVLSQLILCIDLSPELCARLIPTLNVLYIVGRVLYLLGYPQNRSFGFVIANFTIIVTVACNLYSLSLIYI